MKLLKFCILFSMAISLCAWAQDDKKALDLCSVNGEDWTVLNVSNDIGLRVKNNVGCMVLFVTPKVEVNQARVFSLVSNEGNKQKLVAFGGLVLESDDGFVHNSPIEARWLKFPNKQPALRVTFSASRSGAGFGVSTESPHFFHLKNGKFHLLFSYSQKSSYQYSTGNDGCNEVSDSKSTFQYLKTGDIDFPDIKTTTKSTSFLTCDKNGKEVIQDKNTNVTQTFSRWKNGQYFLVK